MRVLALESDRVQADDLFQKVLLKIAKSKPKWRSEAQLKTWVRTVVRSVVYDEWRSNRTKIETVSLSNSDGEYLEQNETERDFFETLQQELDYALKCLTDDEKELVEKIYLHGTPRNEICEAQGISYKSLESRMSRIRQKLRKFIVRDHAE